MLTYGTTQGRFYKFRFHPNCRVAEKWKGSAYVIALLILSQPAYHRPNVFKILAVGVLQFTLSGLWY